MPVVPRLHELITRTKDIIDPIPDPGKFTLDSSGVAGFFGGDGAVSGMATVNLYDYRRWGGWYNTPGSYDIAKQYGRLAESRVWNGLFPGDGPPDPAVLFGLHGKQGPPFIAARSGSSFPHTGHLAHLLEQKAESLQAEPVKDTRQTIPASVTIVDLPINPPEGIEYPKLRRSHSGLLAIIPIAVSIAACILCALDAEWYGFASILVGVIAHGSACFVLGTGRLTFKHPKPAPGAPPGDGILRGDTSIIILRGSESVVNCFTRGRFVLDFSLGLRKPSDSQGLGESAGGQTAVSRANKESSVQDVGQKTEVKPELQEKPNQYLIGLSSLLLTVQFVAQLLLIPQADLFGQLMFITTLAVSWMYNAYLSSLDREDIQTDILLDVLKLDLENDVKKYQFGSWTSMVAFACLALQSNSAKPLEKPERLLDELIPNHTAVWEEWKRAVAARLAKNGAWDAPSISTKDFPEEEDRELLKTLFNDAKAAYNAWQEMVQPPRKSVDDKSALYSQSF